MIKKIKPLFLKSLILCGSLVSIQCLLPCIACAQKIPAVRLDRAVYRIQQIATLSKQANHSFSKRLQYLWQPVNWAPVSAITNHFPDAQSHAVFQVQQTPFARSTASAFALDIEGQVWGVTAAHVMRNIERDPYVKVQNGYGKWVFFPITAWYSGNPHNADVAIFQIPPQALPFIQILKPAPYLPQAKTPLQLQGYVKGNALMVQEPVLFAGPRGIFLLDQTHREMTGFCGSPWLENGRVIGVSMGYTSQSDILKTAWFEVLRKRVQASIPAIHQAVPIQTVRALAAWVSNQPSSQAATPVKLFGQEITQLYPHMHIAYLQQLRHGYVVETKNPGPLVDPEHIEQFFELQAGDVVRIVVQTPRQSAQPEKRICYDVDVTTGQITQTEF